MNAANTAFSAGLLVFFLGLFYLHVREDNDGWSMFSLGMACLTAASLVMKISGEWG